MDRGSKSNLGPSSEPSHSLALTLAQGAQIALQGAHNIGQSLDMLEQAASSASGGICSCEMATSRQEAGPLGVWKNTSWVPVIFIPWSRSLQRLPGRAWLVSGTSTGYLACVTCGGRVAVVSAVLSGSVVVKQLHATLQNTPRKKTRQAR